MIWSLGRPSARDIGRFLDDQRSRALSYREVGATRGAFPAGWTTEHHRRRLGTGAACFTAARTALRAWQMFPAPWAHVEPAAPPTEGACVAAVLHIGVWWQNAMRVIYVEDEPRRFAFACGTLPAHVAIGEECFTVHHAADDSVWYEVRAFTRPRLLAARLAAPVTQQLRARFVRDSLAAMSREVASAAILGA